MFTLEREGRGDEGGEPSYTLSFFLEMSAIGEVQLQVAVRGKALHGEIVVGSGKVLEHMAAQLADLAGILEGLGYSPVGFSCRIGKNSMLQELKSAIEEAAQLLPVRILDVRA